MSAESRPHPRFLWTEQRVQALPLSLKRLLEYVWTGPDVNGAGVTVFEPGVWQSRIGEISLALETGLQMLDKAEHVVYDRQIGEVWPRRWFAFHKFASAPARSALSAGLKQIQSKAIRAAVLDAARLAGVSVDNLMENQRKQRVDLPTPTSTTTSTTTTTKPPPPQDWLDAADIEMSAVEVVEPIVNPSALRKKILERYESDGGPDKSVLAKVAARKSAAARLALTAAVDQPKASPDAARRHLAAFKTALRLKKEGGPSLPI